MKTDFKKLIEENIAKETEDITKDITKDSENMGENISLYTKEGDSQLAQMYKKYNDAVYNVKKSTIIASQLLAQLTFNDKALSRQYAPIHKRFDDILKILQDASKESNKVYCMRKTDFKLRG